MSDAGHKVKTSGARLAALRRGQYSARTRRRGQGRGKPLCRLNARADQESVAETTPLETDQRGRHSDAQLGESADAYDAVTCPGCGRLHFVNKTTGQTLSDKIKPKPTIRR